MFCINRYELLSVAGKGAEGLRNAGSRRRFEVSRGFKLLQQINKSVCKCLWVCAVGVALKYFFGGKG